MKEAALSRIVQLPSGARVRGRALRDTPDSPAAFLLALADGPLPEWPHRRVEWPDFGLPRNRRDALDALAEALAVARGGELVEVAPPLANRGLRVIVPYLRGFGPTRFAGSTTMRSGQQAALAHDLLELIDALGTDDALLAGYDWGGRAACMVAALWPDRAAGLVSGDGYNIQNIPQSGEPIPPAEERSLWYQYYFHSERGRLGLERNRDELCELLWRTWSPTWAQASEAYPRSAPSLRNPDFVPVVIHSYRHRYGLVPGDPRYKATEDK